MIKTLFFAAMLMFGCGDKDGDTGDSDPCAGADADADGYYDPALCPFGDDCDDTDPTVNPGATEILCNNIDDDCGAGDPSKVTPDHPDTDGDGFNVCMDTTMFPDGGDCDDTDPDVHPGANELCNALDDDCDGLFDEDSDGNVGTSNWYDDADGDTYGDSTTSNVCDGAHPEWVNDGTDCDDTLAYAYPGAAENESGCMEDQDDDGWGNLYPIGGATAGTDCVDTKPAAYPGAAYNESATDCMRDGDGDGWGNEHPSNSYITPGTDCDDSLSYAYPGAAELDSATDCMEDQDGDDYGADIPSNTYTTAGTDCNDENAEHNVDAEMDTCDVGDDDCDGTLDEDCADCALEIMGRWEIIIRERTLPSGLADSDNNCSTITWTNDCDGHSAWYDEWCNHVTGETTSLKYNIVIDGFLESDPRVGIGYITCDGIMTMNGSSGTQYDCEDYMYDDLVVLTQYDPGLTPELTVEVRRLSDIYNTVMVWDGSMSSTSTEWILLYDSGDGLWDPSQWSSSSDACGVFVEAGKFELQSGAEHYNDGVWGSTMTSYWSGTTADTVYGPDFIDECSDMYAFNFVPSETDNGYGNPPAFDPYIEPLFMQDFFGAMDIMKGLSESQQHELIDTFSQSPMFQQQSPDPELTVLQLHQMVDKYNYNTDYAEMMDQIQLDWENGTCSDPDAWWYVQRGSWFYGVDNKLWYSGPVGQ